MFDPLTDRAERLLRCARRVAIPLPELADRLRTESVALAAELDRDPRFILVDPTVRSDLSLLPPPDRDRYAAALSAAGVHTAVTVSLAAPVESASGSAVEDLLRESVARVLSTSPEPALAEAAERLRGALREALSAAPPAAGPERAPDGTEPSTTPPHGRGGRGRVPPRRRTRSRRRPPYPGSRRE